MLPDGGGEPVHMIVVTNSSKRPVRWVTAKNTPFEENEIPPPTNHPVLADAWGVMETYALGSTAQAQAFVLKERSSTIPALRAGQAAAFVSGFATARYPYLVSWVRFTDDAGVDWEIDTSIWRSWTNEIGSPQIPGPGSR